MNDDRVDEAGAQPAQASTYAELQQQWHGWGSPVGVGLGLLCLGAGAGTLLTGIAAISAVGVLLS